MTALDKDPAVLLSPVSLHPQHWPQNSVTCCLTEATFCLHSAYRDRRKKGDPVGGMWSWGNPDGAGSKLVGNMTERQMVERGQEGPTFLPDG